MKPSRTNSSPHRKLLRVLGLAVVAGLIALSAAACGEENTPRSTPIGTEAEPSFPPPVSPYEPEIDPADFVTQIDNSYLPMMPGTTRVYKGVTEDGLEKTVVTVTHETKEILGVTCTVVKDVVRVEGEIVEKTFDWFAQDRYGNVWYFGEDSHEYENGKPVNAAGSWEAGVDGALAGIVMLGDPQVDDRYRQEYYKGEAEDMGEVVQFGASVEVPYGSYENVLVTADTTPLEPKVLEHKFYAPGVGLVMEQVLHGPKENHELVAVRTG